MPRNSALHTCVLSARRDQSTSFNGYPVSIRNAKQEPGT